MGDRATTFFLSPLLFHSQSFLIWAMTNGISPFHALDSSLFSLGRTASAVSKEGRRQQQQSGELVVKRKFLLHFEISRAASAAAAAACSRSGPSSKDENVGTIQEMP